MTATPREKIHLAHLATRHMDQLLWRAIEELTDAASAPGNGAGIYPDPSRVRNKIHSAKSALADAEQIMTNTAWPTNEDYDAS